MRVVDKHREVLALLDRLEAPWDANAALERAKQPLQLSAERMRRRQRTERVSDVEPPRHRQAHPAHSARRAQVEAGTREVEAQIFREVVRREPLAAGRLYGERDRTVELARQPRAVGVADVDHAERRAMLGEQAALGQEVILHRVVEVEVVLRQVREDRRREVHRVGATELERVRGDLDRARPVAAVEHRAEHRLQIDRLRGRASHLALLPADDRGDRAEQSALLAHRLLQQGAHEVGRRRLAVRSRDADDAQLRGRIAVEARRDRGHRRARRADQHFRHAELQASLHDQRRRARLECLLRELVPVALKAADAEEQLPVAHRAAVVGQARDLDAEIAGGLERQTGRQLVEPHRLGCYPGGMRRYGSAKLMIWPNAGAATVPPKIEPFCGSSTITAHSSLGCEAGAKPMNDAT